MEDFASVSAGETVPGEAGVVPGYSHPGSLPVSLGEGLSGSEEERGGVWRGVLVPVLSHPPCLPSHVSLVARRRGAIGSLGKSLVGLTD